MALYLGLFDQAEQALANALDEVGTAHRNEPDVENTCKILGDHVRDHAESLRPIVERYGEQGDAEPERLAAAEFSGSRSGAVGLLRDLQDLYALASFVDITWTVVKQAAQGLRDDVLLKLAGEREADTSMQQLTGCRPASSNPSSGPDRRDLSRQPGARGLVAGPSRMLPSGANRDP